jgi:hypothetical protein
MLTTKIIHFVKLSKYRMDFTITFLSLRRSKNIYRTSNSESGWRVIPLERCSVVESFDRCRDFWESWKNMLGCLEVFPKEFRLSRVPTRVRTSDKPNKKPCSDLTFWILIWTIPNSWETWKIRLGEVFYWNKTTPSIYERIMANWVPIYPIVKNTTYQLLFP